MNILIAGGGTGGHIFPALSLAQELRRKNPANKIIFVGSDRKLELELFKKNNCDYRILKLVTPPTSLSFKVLLFLLQFIRALFKSFKLVKEFKPQVVVGFGSYTSVAVILAAKFSDANRGRSTPGRKNITILIHEQNVYPGRANRFLGILADKIAISFRESQDYVRQKNKIVITGNPVRFSFLNKDKAVALKYFKLVPDKFTILVMGGSQGAHFLNQALVKLISILRAEERDKLQFIHLTGTGDFNWVKQCYQNYEGKAAIFSFLDEMDLAYLASDLVIGRAGATAIAEICTLGRPSILVPYPYAGGHQKFNALVLKKKGAAVVLEQKELSAKILKDNLINLMNDKKRLENISANSSSLSFAQAGENLAREVLSLC